jgi:hypothetical protein
MRHLGVTSRLRYDDLTRLKILPNREWQLSKRSRQEKLEREFFVCGRLSGCHFAVKGLGGSWAAEPDARGE